MEIMYSQHGAHLSGVKCHPIDFITMLGYKVLSVKSYPACDNVVATVTRKLFSPVGEFPDFIKVI